MRSKPDPVDQPERTAHYDCAMCIAEILHNTRPIAQRQFCSYSPSSRPTSLFRLVSEMTYNVSMGTLNPTIPYHCSDEAKWRLGGTEALRECKPPYIVDSLGDNWGNWSQNLITSSWGTRTPHRSRKFHRNPFITF